LLYVWRPTLQNREVEYDRNLCTTQKQILDVDEVSYEKKTELVRLQVRLWQDRRGKVRQWQEKTLKFGGTKTKFAGVEAERPFYHLDLFLHNLLLVKATGKDTMKDLIPTFSEDSTSTSLMFQQATGLRAMSKVIALVTEQGQPLDLPEEQLKNAGPQALQQLLSREFAGVPRQTTRGGQEVFNPATRAANEKPETLHLCFHNPLPLDYDQAESSFNQDFYPWEFDVRKIRKVVGKTIPAAAGETVESYSLREVYASETEVISCSGVAVEDYDVPPPAGPRRPRRLHAEVDGTSDHQSGTEAEGEGHRQEEETSSQRGSETRHYTPRPSR
ncbi:unnamed protein product, partial [Amoebophrya sp. A25]